MGLVKLMKLTQRNKGYLVIGAVVLVLSAANVWKMTNDSRTALDSHREKSHLDSQAAAKDVSAAFGHIYTNLRTISFLPSVRDIDRHGENLNEDALESIQQIYNNLASSVDVSEIYVTPASFDPNRIDPVTGEPEIPILMFDQLIVNSAAASTGEEAAGGEELEAVEGEEYQLLTEQMAWFRSNHPKLLAATGLDVPIIGGRSVLTCDNSEYATTLKDADRTGVVLSVPFYDRDGVLKGAVSAVVLNNALRDLLPETNYALINKAYGLHIPAAVEGQQTESFESISLGEVDPSLLYSELLPIETNDPQGQWIVWAGLPDKTFQNGPEMGSINGFFYMAFAVLGLCAAGGGFGWTMLQKNLSVMTEKEEVEKYVQEVRNLMTTQERDRAKAEEDRRELLNATANDLEGAFSGIIAELSRTADGLQNAAATMSQSSDATRQQATSAAVTTQEANSLTRNVASAAGQLAQSVVQITAEVARSATAANLAVVEAERTADAMADLQTVSGKVGEVVNLINDIAEQTNLLALNATIEAARAGESGKGFAVVAMEVKSLATQTARATSDIVSQINAMKKTTQNAVSAVTRVRDKITEMNSISTAISAAVEEQSAATQHISESVQRIAEGSDTVTMSVDRISSSAVEAAGMANRVIDTARSVARNSASLRETVEGFTQRVRAG
jgi:methyl-accepting chemotaxis protein